MKIKADIFNRMENGINYVVVVDNKGNEIFKREKTQQTINIANAIYISCKYGG